MVKILLSVLFLCIFQLIHCIHFEGFKKHGQNETTEKPWPGKWFPRNPNVIKLDDSNRIKMGVKNPDCDNGTVHLEIDWFDDPVNYTCFHNRRLFKPNINEAPILQIDMIPKSYMAPHACMNKSITYDSVIPTFGEHRPLWPKYGEYKFVPRQRWIHNLEHGGVVMLYHPCANRLEVDKLRKLVTKCLYRHIITPYNMLSPAKPLSLVTWGKRLEMSVVSTQVVIDFIRENALNGPEKTSRDGQYDHAIIHHAEIITTEDDGNVCPNNF